MAPATPAADAGYDSRGAAGRRPGYRDRVRGLLQRVGENDPDAEAALRVIARFDELGAAHASLAELVAAAAAVTGCVAGAGDVGGSRVLQADPDGACSPARLDYELLAAVPSFGPREVDGRLAAAVELADGRAGVVWLEAGEREFAELDHVVVERLAATVALEFTRHLAATPVPLGDRAELEGLAAGLRDGDAAAVAVRRAGLRPAGCYLAVAVEAGGAVPASTDAVGRVVLGALPEQGRHPHFGVLGRRVLVVVEAGSAADTALETLAGAPRVQGLAVLLGVGEAGPAESLHRSWTQARQALAIAPPGRHGRISRFRDLGALALLADLPHDQVAALPDVAALRDLEQEGDAGDLRLLELYCEVGSLRVVAARIHMHHSSVDYRLKRLERLLGYRLSTGALRLRALLALTLLRAERARLTADS